MDLDYYITRMDFYIEDHIAEFKEAFDLLDPKGQGRVPTKELKTVIKAIDPTAKKKDIYLMAKLVDPTGVGDFGFDEFLEALRRRMREPDLEAELYKAFKIFDKDGDDFISPTELRHLMTNMGEKYTDAEIKQMIKIADVGQKGKVNFEDFIKLITQS